MFIDPLRDAIALRQEGHVCFRCEARWPLVGGDCLVFHVPTLGADMALLTEVRR